MSQMVKFHKSKKKNRILVRETVLENSSVLSKKKGIETVPLWQSSPWQNCAFSQNSALGAPFHPKKMKMVPS